ncbi:MAG: YraN family protein [Alphaproteobacteria bacterium]|nr:MAG: YraN family protein [Alphaproteobacteria bacterium]
MKRKRRRAYFRGRAAEFVAALSLRFKGYHIVAQDFRRPVGEIDIIVRRGRLLAAVEVKARARYRDAAEAVGPKQKRRIARALEAFVVENPRYHGFDLRFDVLLVTSLVRWPRHIEGAFH